MSALVMILLVIVSLFLMFIVLLQRGRGGGLAGALGGMGGQSAFGTKAGDVFTRITVVVAAIWVLLNCASIFANRAVQESYFSGRGGAATEGTSIRKAPAADKEAGKTAPAAKEEAAPKAKTATKKSAPPAPESSAPAGESKSSDEK